MDLLYKFLGYDNFNSRTRNLMKKYTFFEIYSLALFGLTNTLYVLHLIDQIGYLKASHFFAFSVFIQIIVDYPSGTLGDYIGQKWVLFFSKLMAAISIVIFAFSESFGLFLFCAFLFGISNAQSSGSLQSWLDNNYQIFSAEVDLERKNYGFTLNRIFTLASLVMGTMIILGGFLATFQSRKLVFIIEALLSVILAILYIKFLTTYEQIPSVDEENSNGYFQTLIEGIRVTKESKPISYFILGHGIVETVWYLWGSLILIPIYFLYSGSDGLTGLLRSIIFFLGVIIGIKMASIAKKLDNNRLPRLLFLQMITLFPLVILLLEFVNATNTFNLFGFVCLILIFGATTSTLSPIIHTLTQRIYVNLIPSKQRNAIYSLSPTISGILKIITLPIIGFFIESYNLQLGIISLIAIGLIGCSFVLLALNQVTHTKPLKRTEPKKIESSTKNIKL